MAALMLKSGPNSSSLFRAALLWAVAIGACSALRAAEPTAVDGKALIPWDKIDAENRAKLEEVVDHATVYHRSRSEVFAAPHELYLLLLHEPVLTLELWKALGVADATLEEVRLDQFEGSDGHASSGRWEFIYKSPELHVIYAEGQYRGPLLGSTLQTKSVLVLRTAFIEEPDGKRYVKHQLDGFVKAESGSLKTLTKTLRPIFHKSVDATMQESLWFVSLMCRYAVYDPRAVADALEHTDRVSDSLKARVQKLLVPLVAAAPTKVIGDQ